eukprot:m.78506 g.78506  ORF g.78506 m.78506 type:complete len:153 (+) comp14112_c1_seq1:274-732(+)
MHSLEVNVQNESRDYKRQARLSCNALPAKRLGHVDSSSTFGALAGWVFHCVFLGVSFTNGDVAFCCILIERAAAELAFNQIRVFDRWHNYICTSCCFDGCNKLLVLCSPIALFGLLFVFRICFICVFGQRNGFRAQSIEALLGHIKLPSFLF